MTTSITPELDHLADAIRTELAHPGDWAAIADRVAEAVRANLPTPAPGYRHVEPDGSFSVLAIAWAPGQWTAIHDHVTWCVFATLAGEPVEELFALDGDVLRPVGREPCPVGTVNGTAPPGDIHRLGNPHAEPAITLHVYGTDVSRIGTSLRRTYDPRLLSSAR
jgi:predicted metal-dependent enzyme (double-stranded beta helix superfamily)